MVEAVRSGTMHSLRSQRRRPRRLPSARPIALASLCALLAAAGCAAPFSPSPPTDKVRASLLAKVRADALGGREAPSPRPLTREPGELGLSPERIEQLQESSGLRSYASTPGDLGVALPDDLLGGEAGSIELSLDEAIRLAVQHNLAGESARFDPAIAVEQEIVADAAFDWLLFADAGFARNDNPTAVPVVNGVPVGTALNRSDAFDIAAGAQKATRDGGVVTAQTSLDIFNNQSPGFSRSPDPAYTANLDLTLSQPLARGFGRDVNLAEVRLAENATRSATERLRQTLMDIVTETERAYWTLALARYELRVRERLLDRGVQTRDALRGRLDFDVTQAELADAVATVESRRADVIRAANRVRIRNDELKRLINDPSEPLAGESLIIPAEIPVDASIEFSLVDSLAEALAMRPEVRVAELSIRDADIREAAARNLRLPLVNLDAAVNLTGLDDDGFDAYRSALEDDFFDASIGLRLEQQLGNRGPEANLRSARLERLRSVVDYRDAVQAVVLDVKTALRNVATNYRLIEQSRVTRLAAAENLRALQAEEETIRSLTPEFLNLKLTRQEALATAEFLEAQALADYATSLADLDRAVGRTLERRGLTVVAPTESVAEEFFDGDAPAMTGAGG